jgi:hypothetical protein
MATVAQLETALMKADAAGDDAAAREIAAEIKRVRVAPRKKTSRTEAVISGIERGMKPVAEALDYLNPFSYIPKGPKYKAREARTEKQLGTQGARAQKDRPNYFTGGKIAGEVLATAPVGIGVGTGIRLGGKALTNVAPRVASALEKVGRATVTGGAGVRAPSKVAAEAGANIVKSRGGRVATRAAGGTITGLTTAALTDSDLIEAASAGALVPVLGHMAKFGAGKTFDTIAGRLGEVRAAEILREIVSGNTAAITKALQNAPKQIKASTAEFLASKGLLTPEIAAVTRIATAGKSGGELLDVATERAAGQKRVMDRLRGGETQTNAMTNIAAAKRQLQDETNVLRKNALGTADIGRLQIVPAEQKAAAAAALARELENSARRLTGASKNFGDSPMFTSGADQAKYSADQAFADARTAEDVAANLRAQGLEPLDVSKVVANLRAEADKAEFVSPDRYKILSEFANNLQRRAAKFNGTIDATGLNLARREMSAFVSSILGTSDPKALRLGTSQLVAAAQKPIDDAIDAAAGTPPGQVGPYRKYLDAFSGGMKGIERQQFQRELTKLTPARFSKVMAGEDPDFVESILGPGRFDVNLELQGPALSTAKKLGKDFDAQRAVAQTGLQDLAQTQKLGFAQGAQAKVGGMLEPRNVLAMGARVAGSVPKIGGGGVAAAQMAEKMAERSSENVMENLVPALAQPSRAASLLQTRSSEDYINKLLYGSGNAPVRQNVMAQTAMRPFNQPSAFEFPEFDPESGEPLVDIDFSEGYPVPIYGTQPKNMRFKSLNAMRR